MTIFLWIVAIVLISALANFIRYKLLWMGWKAWLVSGLVYGFLTVIVGGLIGAGFWGIAGAISGYMVYLLWVISRE